jgi:predicted nucleic acid-binding protein
MIVLDASALADILLPTPHGRAIAPLVREAAGDAHVPSLLDAEVTSVVRRAERRGELEPLRAEAVLADLEALALVRHPYRPLLRRAWELRANFTVYDALYVALAEIAGAPFLTTDQRLAAAVARHTAVALAAD